MTTTDGIKHGGSSGYVISKCRCDQCKAWKSATDRSYRQRMGDELRAKKRQYVVANAEALRAYRAARRAERTPEERAAMAAYQREWARQAYANGRPRTQATKDRRRQRDLDRRAEIRKNEADYRERNADRRRDWEAARRARIRNADIRTVTVNDWRRLCLRYRNRCAYCDACAVLTQDHIIPLARGGRHAIGNLLPACGSCNSSKNDRLIIEWRAVMRP